MRKFPFFSRGNKGQSQGGDQPETTDGAPTDANPADINDGQPASEQDNAAPAAGESPTPAPATSDDSGQISIVDALTPTNHLPAGDDLTIRPGRRSPGLDLGAPASLKDGDQGTTAPSRLQKLRGTAKKTFNFAADMTGRMAVTSVLKIAAVSFVVGAGFSAASAAAIGIGVAAVGSAAYTYTKETYTEWRARKDAGEEVSFVNVLRNSTNMKQRMQRTATSLACGVAFGALGAWAMQTDVGQSILEKVGGFFGFGGDAPAAPVADSAAAAPAAPVADAAPAPAPAAVHVADAPATTAASTAASTATDAGADAAAASAGGAGNVHVSVSAPDHADINITINGETIAGNAVGENPLAAGLAQAGISNPDAVSAQALKDAAHEILRDQTIGAAERVEMARALAQEALERGNDQAATFLGDIARVESTLGLEPTVADAAPATVDVAPAAPVADAPIIGEMPADTVAGGTTGGEVSVSELPSLAPVFGEEAARCTVSFENNLVTGAECTVAKPEMAAGDYITFADAGDAGRQASVSLSEGSVTVSTNSMLQETVLAEGVNSLQAQPRVSINVNLNM